MNFKNKIISKYDNFQKLFKNKPLKFSQIPWQLWIFLPTLFFGGLGYIAISSLMMTPNSPDCNRIFWPLASASMRLYCAQSNVQKDNLESLLQAIELVKVLPKDHPLSPEVNLNIDRWSKSILVLAEKDFQEGRIDQSIEKANKIPSRSKVHSESENKIKAWRLLWEQGNSILAQIEIQLKKGNWDSALILSDEILSIKNKYWSTVEYDKAVKKIQTAQQQGEQLNLALSYSKKGDLTNVLKSIDILTQIPSDSYVYNEVKALLEEDKQNITGLVRKAIIQTNWQEFRNILNLVSTRSIFKDNLNSWQIFLEAINYIQLNTPESFRSATFVLGRINSTDPLYDDAQNLIKLWNLAINDLTYINQASQTAQWGTVKDYQNAIIQLGQVPVRDPLYGQANNLNIPRQQKLRDLFLQLIYCSRALQFDQPES